MGLRVLAGELAELSGVGQGLESVVVLSLEDSARERRLVRKSVWPWVVVLRSGPGGRRGRRASLLP